MKHKYDFEDPYTIDKLLDDRLMKGAKLTLSAVSTLYKEEPELPQSQANENMADVRAHGPRAPNGKGAGEAMGSDRSLQKPRDRSPERTDSPRAADNVGEWIIQQNMLPSK